MNRIHLNNGIDIPQIGLGVYRTADGQKTIEAIHTALAAGYRHIDTAAAYGNESSVGEAVRTAPFPREEIFVTTKVRRDDVGYDSTLRAFDASLASLGLTYVDLYLIHWPTVDRRLDGWRAMERILADGKARAIGVSNYMVHHLQELLEHSTTVPAINQIELHPYNYGTRRPLLDFCAEQNIVIEAYSPLTKGQKLDDPSLMTVATQVGKSPAQVLIRWAIQKGLVVLPKSENPVRIRENGDVYGFVLSDDAMDSLDGLDEQLVVAWDPTNAP